MPTDQDRADAIRDIAHEQIAASTTEELRERRRELEQEAFLAGGLPLDKLAEHHGILSELYCRQVGIRSEPWVTHVGRGA